MRQGKVLQITFCVVILFSCAFFTFLYWNDNKYKNDPNEGIQYLYDNWEFYYGALLTPQDLKNGDTKGAYMEYVTIGEVNNYSNHNPYRGAHGCGTYVLHLKLAAEKTRYAIEIPEIYSAYRFYVNDELVGQCGEPGEDDKNYREGIQTKIYSFEAAGECTLLLETRDESHYYSGMTYPLALGEESVVLHHVYRRIIFYTTIAVLCALNILFTLYYCVKFRSSIKEQEQRKNVMIFTGIAFCGILFMGYPLVHYLWQCQVHPWYTLELMSGYVITFLIVLLHNRLTQTRHIMEKGVGYGIAVLAAVMCVIVFLYGNFSARLTLRLEVVFSFVVFWYKIVIAFYLVGRSVISVYRQQTEGVPLLTGSLFYACSYMWDRIYSKFEPIYGGWFAEWATIIMIFASGFVLWRRILQNVKQAELLQKQYEAMEKQMKIQVSHMEKVNETVEYNRRIRHDFRHHLHAIDTLAKEGKVEKVSEYVANLSEYHKKGRSQGTLFCKNTVINALLQYYEDNADQSEIKTVIRVSADENLPVPEVEFCIIIGNLLENAIDASRTLAREKRKIEFYGKQEGAMYLISSVNYYEGEIRKRGRRFQSSKHTGNGVGIWSVEKVVEKYNGMMTIDVGEQKFEVKIAIPIE